MTDLTLAAAPLDRDRAAAPAAGLRRLRWRAPSCSLFNIVVHPALPVRRELPHPGWSRSRPVADRRARHGAGRSAPRASTCRWAPSMALAASLLPLYLGYGPLPAHRSSALVGGAVVGAGQRLARRLRRRPADRRHPGAARRRPRPRPGARSPASSRTSATRTCSTSAPATSLGVPYVVLIAAVLALLVAVRRAAHDLRPAARSPSAATGRPRGSPGCRSGGS